MCLVISICCCCSNLRECNCLVSILKVMLRYYEVSLTIDYSIEVVVCYYNLTLNCSSLEAELSINNCCCLFRLNCAFNCDIFLIIILKCLSSSGIYKSRYYNVLVARDEVCIRNLICQFNCFVSCNRFVFGICLSQYCIYCWISYLNCLLFIIKFVMRNKDFRFLTIDVVE